MHLALAFTMPYLSGRLLVTEYGEVCLYSAGCVVECPHRGVKRLLSATDIHSMQRGLCRAPLRSSGVPVDE